MPRNEMLLSDAFSRPMHVAVEFPCAAEASDTI